MNSQLILEVLKKVKRPTNVLLDIFIGGYNYKKAKRRALYPTLPDFSEIDGGSKTLEKKRHNFYSLLFQLKRQGFVKREHKGNKTHWKITSLGEKRLEKIKNIFRFPKLIYKQEKDNGLNMIVFDVPEKYKSKRDWLRQNLLALDFTMLQKSVWMGKNKLPEEFLKTLNELGLIDFIHIFKITRTGTIQKLDF